MAKEFRMYIEQLNGLKRLDPYRMNALLDLGFACVPRLGGREVDGGRDANIR